MASSTTVGGIKVKISSDTTSLESGLKKTREGLNKVGKYAAVASVAMVAAGAAMVSAQLKVLDALGKTADALGIQQEKLQALQHVAELTGTSSEQFNRALERMEKNLGNASRIGGTAADALEDIGVSIEDILKLSPDEQIESLAVALTGVESQAMKASIANDIFGRSGVRMLKMLQALKDDGLAPTETALAAMGITLSRIDTSKVEQANDAIFKAGEVATGLANKLTVKLSPILEAISNQFIDAAMEAEGFGDTVNEAFSGAVTVIGVFSDGLRGLEVVSAGINVAFKAMGAAIIKVFHSISITFDNMINGVKMGLNLLIDDVNSLPGIDIEKLVTGSSAASKTLNNVLSNAMTNLEEAQDSLHKKMMEPLPSQQLKQWLVEVEEASTKAAELLTASVTGDGEESKSVDQDAINKAAEEIESLMTLNQTKLEAINVFEAEKIALLKSYLEQELITKSEHDAALTEVERNGADARVALARTEAATKKAMQQQFFNDLASLMNSGSKKAFQIGKVAALANAGISGVSSAISAWEAGMSVGGPFAPATAAAYAGASILKTGSMMQQISSQSFGSPSKTTSFSGGIPTVNTTQTAQQSSTNVSIDIVGSEGATFSRSQIESLIGGINDATGDGVTLNVGT